MHIYTNAIANAYIYYIVSLVPRPLPETGFLGVAWGRGYYIVVPVAGAGEASCWSQSHPVAAFIAHS